MCRFLVLRQRTSGVETSPTVFNATEVCNKSIASIDSTVFCTLMINTASLVGKCKSTFWVWAPEYFLITTLPLFFVFLRGFCFLKFTHKHSKECKISRLTRDQARNYPTLEFPIIAFTIAHCSKCPIRASLAVTVYFKHSVLSHQQPNKHEKNPNNVYHIVTHMACPLFCFQPQNTQKYINEQIMMHWIKIKC